MLLFSVLFQKISLSLPPRVLWVEPHPSRESSFCSYFLLEFKLFRPRPPWNFQFPHWGWYGYCLELHIHTSMTSIATHPDYLGVSCIQTESPSLLYESPNLQDKTKAHKMDLSDIFWQILGILRKTVKFLFNELLRFNQKLMISQILIRLGWHLLPQ